MQTQLKEKEVLNLYDRHIPREVIPVHEELHPDVIETRYIPARKPVIMIPDVPEAAVRDTLIVISDNTGKLVHWSVFALLRAGELILLIVVHVVRILGLGIKAVVSLLLSGVSGRDEDEDTGWEPEPRKSGNININVTVNQNNY